MSSSFSTLGQHSGGQGQGIVKDDDLAPPLMTRVHERLMKFLSGDFSIFLSPLISICFPAFAVFLQLSSCSLTITLWFALFHKKLNSD